jgi:hypothetical protein
MAYNAESAQTLHHHVVMWLDKHIGEPGNNETMKNRFRRVTHPLETFTDSKSAIDSIHQQQAAGKSVFLIVSGSLADEIVPKIFDCECVVQIFLFCANMQKYVAWAEPYINKLMMFDSDEELLIRLTNDIAKYLTEEANKYKQSGQKDKAIGLLNWADWLYDDADTLQRAVCRAIRADIRRRLEEFK